LFAWGQKSVFPFSYSENKLWQEHYGQLKVATGEVFQMVYDLFQLFSENLMTVTLVIFKKKLCFQSGAT
jgi:hypothetical protein